MTRRRFTWTAVAILLAVGLLPRPGRAQSSSAGAIAGVAKDTSGAVLPGVSVEATSPALIEKTRTVITDAEGQYKIIDLRPGTYVVTFSLSGFGDVRREGIDLTAGFTATVNADMRVGGVAETITVSGAAPIVDTHEVRSQNVLSREVLDTLPTSKTLPSFSALTLGMSHQGPRDVGGATGEAGAGALMIHGSLGGDQRYTLDGMFYNAATGQAGGFNRYYFANQASTEEVAIETGGMTADTETGGVQVNVIPKDGGNTFRGTFRADGSWNGLLSNNQPPGGPRASIRRLYDVNGGVGGPIVVDRLWFYTAHWKRVGSTTVPGNYWNKNQASVQNSVTVYAPDLSRPAYIDDHTEDHNVRLTWQLGKHRFAGSYGWQSTCNCFYSIQFNQAPEAGSQNEFHPKLAQLTWTYPVTSRLLVQGGATHMPQYLYNPLAPGAGTDHFPITELSTGYTYNARPGVGFFNRGKDIADQTNGRFSISYITGSHALKAGFAYLIGLPGREESLADDVPMAYTFLRGVPNTVTFYSGPNNSRQRAANLGTYVQDQWTVKRLTLNLGVRFDSLYGWYPDQTIAAGFLTSAQNVSGAGGLPTWKDVSPRFGASYDLFGDGKTALKVTFGRYVNGELVSLSQANNPANAIVTSATRPWLDANGDFIPQPGELGPLSNNAFGTPIVVTRYAADVLDGWHIRPRSKQTSVLLQHQLLPNVAVFAGYYHIPFGNFRVTQNLANSPMDWNSYCITVPTDSRLPGGGGNQLCGLYDLNPSKLGQVNNLVTRASNFGQHTDVSNSVDVGTNAKTGRLQVGGGISWSRLVVNDCLVVNSPSVQNAGFTGPGAGSIRPAGFCKATNPYVPSVTGNPPTGGIQIKANGSYTLPLGVQAAVVYQNLPGLPILANVVTTNAQIAPSLGRNLSACGAAAVCNATVTIPVVPHDSDHLGRFKQFDLRLNKRVRLANVRVNAMVDLYNLTNAYNVNAVNYTYGPSWLVPTQSTLGRLVKFGAQLEF